MIGITDDVDWNHLVKENKDDPIVDRVKKDPNDISLSGGKDDTKMIPKYHGG